MADIQRFPFLRHLRGAPTVHVRHQRRGKLVHAGAGLAFWFRPLTAVLSEVPIDDRELPLLFHARTSDFQDVTVQASVTYRVVDPARAADRLDFSIAPDSGQWRSTPLEQVAALLSELAQQHALDLLAAATLPSVLAAGPGAIRERIAAGLDADSRLADIGLAVLGVRVVAVRPEPDVARALQTPTREQIQQDADRAPTSAGHSPSSGSGRSARTSCRARSSWRSARNGWSPSAVRTSAARPKELLRQTTRPPRWPPIATPTRKSYSGSRCASSPGSCRTSAP